MLRALYTLAALAALAAALEAAAAAAQQPAVRHPYRSRVDLVSLTVAVTDARRRFVHDLLPEHFQVLEDGRPQDVAFFSETGTPLSVVIVIDSSGSMDEAMATAQEAAIAFAHSLRPGDRGAVVDFDTEVRVLQSFTTDVDALERAILGATAEGRTALYDAVHTSLKELDALPVSDPARPDRRAIVLLSDGEDTSSRVGFEALLAVANRSATSIYAVGLGEGDADGRPIRIQAELALRQLALQSGGRAFFPTHARQLPAVYHEISAELASQYALAYASSNTRRDGQWRSISIRMPPGLEAHARPGYYGPR
jgi:Ca-activated chloride channel family protein